MKNWNRHPHFYIMTPPAAWGFLLNFLKLFFSKKRSSFIDLDLLIYQNFESVVTSNTTFYFYDADSLAHSLERLAGRSDSDCIAACSSDYTLGAFYQTAQVPALEGIMETLQASNNRPSESAQLHS
jgi:hypothetical protein